MGARCGCEVWVGGMAIFSLYINSVYKILHSYSNFNRPVGFSFYVHWSSIASNQRYPFCMIAHTFHMYSSLPYTTAWFSLSNFSPSATSGSRINPRKELSGVWADNEEEEKTT